MSPSTTVRRAGVVTASALALSLGGAFTAGSASALTVCPVGELLSSTGKCVKKTVTSVTQPTPTSSSSSSSSGSSGSGGGISIPLPSIPVPTYSSSGGSGSGSSGGSSSGGSGGGLQLPHLPGVNLPGLGGQTGGSSGGIGGVGGSGGLNGPTVPGTKGTTTATSDGSSVPGSQPGAAGAGSGGGMLSPASAYLPAGAILGFSSFGGSGGALMPTVPSPLMANTIPSPLMANQPASQLADVQAPLLAAGEDAGKGGTMLAAFGGYTLPGLLVVLATAVVATVGAGNIRVWQARIAARRAA